MPERYDNVRVTIPALGIERLHATTVIRGANSTRRTFVWWNVPPRRGTTEDPDVDVPNSGAFIEVGR